MELRDFSLIAIPLRDYSSDYHIKSKNRRKDFINFINCEKKSFLLFHADEKGIIGDYEKLQDYMKNNKNAKLICCYPKKVIENYPELSDYFPDEIRDVNEIICTSVGTRYDFTFYVLTKTQSLEFRRLTNV